MSTLLKRLWKQHDQVECARRAGKTRGYVHYILEKHTDLTHEEICVIVREIFNEQEEDTEEA